MVSTSDCIVKSKPIAANKVSKPLMEKKRRARINKCLDQLKSLLESYYANSIRKRKLEKADILELTVKHLRNLQKTQSCPSSASELPDYHAGFRSCLASVNQYLRMADNMSGSDRWMLSQLSNKLCCSRGPGEVSSTSDSDLSKTQEAAMQRLQPSSAELQTSGPKRALLAAIPTQNTLKISCSAGHSSKFHSVTLCRNEVVTTQQSVWRPW
uniref:Hairy-related 3 n=1 Tax=Myripristis murdjan TaxID=586833 RepID=A0A667Y2V5_9TELE